MERQQHDVDSGVLAASTNDFIMRRVAGTLDDASMQAIAGWLGALPLAP